MNGQTIKYHRPPGLPGVELLHLSDPDFGFGPHMHEAYVFWLNGQGGERVSLGGSSDILQPDSFGVVAPGDVHANHAVTERRTLESLYVEQGVIGDIGEQCGIHRSEFRSRLLRDRASRGELAKLHFTLLRTDDAFLARESLLQTFSLLLERHGENGVSNYRRRDPAKVRFARTIMRDRFDEPLDLDLLAAQCGCSACHLIRLFKRETGMTPHAYLMEVRLGRARQMLSDDTPISHIAHDAGFTDQSHLTRRFRSRFGLTPALYRRQIHS